MKRDTSNPTTPVENYRMGLISQESLTAAAAQVRIPNRRYRVTVVNCVSSLIKQVVIQDAQQDVTVSG